MEKMTVKKMREEIKWIQDISSFYRDKIQYLKDWDELNYSLMTRLYKENNFTDIRDFIDWYHSGI